MIYPVTETPMQKTRMGHVAGGQRHGRAGKEAGGGFPSLGRSFIRDERAWPAEFLVLIVLQSN